MEQPLSYVVLEFYAWNPKWETFRWNPALVDPAKPKLKEESEKDNKGE